MVQVAIDVDACTDLVAQLRDFHDTASHQRTRVQRIAHRARCSSVGVDNLETELDLIARSASDLDARVVLAVLVNTGDAHPTAGKAHVFSVDGADTADAVRLALGKQLGTRLGDVRARWMTGGQPTRQIAFVMSELQNAYGRGTLQGGR